MKALFLLLCLAGGCLAGDYIPLETSRWGAAKIRPEKLHYVQAVTAQITRNKSRYETVSKATGVPWQVIGCIHSMEASLNFRLGLYCGDPLTARTRHEPKGLPKTGNPPFQWEAVAIDALRYDHLDREKWTPIGQLLYNIEAYNGTGYLRDHPSVPTPYLWSYTTVYSKGKYVADGKFDRNAVSEECGVASILRVLDFSP